MTTATTSNLNNFTVTTKIFFHQAGGRDWFEFIVRDTDGGLRAAGGHYDSAEEAQAAGEKQAEELEATLFCINVQARVDADAERDEPYMSITPAPFKNRRFVQRGGKGKARHIVTRKAGYVNCTCESYQIGDVAKANKMLGKRNDPTGCVCVHIKGDEIRDEKEAEAAAMCAEIAAYEAAAEDARREAERAELDALSCGMNPVTVTRSTPEYRTELGDFAQ